MLSLVSESGGTVGDGQMWGSVFCAETPHGRHLHPVRGPFEAVLKQENFKVFCSREKRLPAYAEEEQGPVVEYIAPAGIIGFFGPAVFYFTSEPIVD